MNPQDSVIELVDETYAAAMEPVRYDAFMASWERYIEACLEAGGDASFTSLENSPVHAHFARGLEILDRLGRVRRTEATAADLVKLVLGAGMVINDTGHVLAANPSAEAALAVTGGAALADSKIDAAAVARILDWARASEHEADAFLFARCFVGAGETPSCFLATRIVLSEGAAPVGPEPGAKHFLLTSIDLHIDDTAVGVLTEAFGLSGAEAEVAVQLGEGRTPNEIAKERSASINTIRTQIKKILKKTNAHGIPDLVRILCGIAAGYSSNRAAGQSVAQVNWPSGTRPAQSLVLPDGRRLSYVEHGDLQGRPVLFFHTMLYGTVMTDSFADACQRMGWRVIAPSRPGFGDSDLNGNDKGAALVDQTVQDTDYLLSHLKVDQAVVLGHVAGSIYAQRFALRFPQRTRGLLYINHAPHWREEFMDDLPRRQRLLAKSTRYAPAALPFLTRAGVALIDAGGHDAFIDALHQDAAEDRRALRRPDVYHAVIDGLRHTVKRGTAGFCLDCPLVLTDWAKDARGLNLPLRILHGAGDLVVTQNYIEGYVEQVPSAAVTTIEGAGQFLLFSHWPRVLDQLKLLDKESAG